MLSRIIQDCDLKKCLIRRLLPLTIHFKLGQMMRLLKQRRHFLAEGAAGNYSVPIKFSAQIWLKYCRQVSLADSVQLAERVAPFLFAMTDGLKERFPELKNSSGPVFLWIALKGIEISRTHTREQLESEFGIQLSEDETN
jgi:hypothetical protein